MKWPNDVWIDGRKCAGVLIEARPRDGWAVIGVGLNVSIAPEEFPAQLRESAISVGGGATVAEALEALNASLSRWTNADSGKILEQFRRRDALNGQNVGWAGGGGGSGTGVADGIDDRGHLLVVIADGGRVSLGAGEVHLNPR